MLSRPTQPLMVNNYSMVVEQDAERINTLRVIGSFFHNRIISRNICPIFAALHLVADRPAGAES